MSFIDLEKAKDMMLKKLIWLTLNKKKSLRACLCKATEEEMQHKSSSAMGKNTSWSFH